MTEPKNPLGLDQQLCFSVYAAAHAFTAAYKPLLDPLGLTYPQYLVLVVLWERDGMMVKEIAARLHLDSGTLSPILKRLEGGGFIRRIRAPENERQLRIELTEKGRALREKAVEARHGVVCALGGSEERVQEIKRATDEILRCLRPTRVAPN
jgi:DNA-binding MarR family transcriptional regulator